jgi:hypothetical protein
MNVEIGTEAPIFLFWEYLFRNFGILSLQCSDFRSLEARSCEKWSYVNGIIPSVPPSGKITCFHCL